MVKDYTGYKADQLLNDDYFLESELHPTENNRLFWQQLQTQNDSLAKEIEAARYFLKHIKVSAETSDLSFGEQKSLWKRIQTANQEYDKKKRRVSFIKITAAIAASLLLLFIYEWYSIYSFKHEVDYEAIIQSVPQTNDSAQNVQLILSENKKLSIEGKETKVAYNKEGNISVNSLEVEVEEEKEETQSFNQLIVPIGKRSSITFVDGSKIWVNSGSKVIYPAKFTDDKREIFVEGEIYLDIVHDEKRPFIVKTRKMEVRDLGTEFNVSAYENESNTNVVLVEGIVEILVKGEKKSTLIPSQLYQLNNLNNKSSIQNIDTKEYVAWKDGYYQFRQQKLDVVLEKLCKYYGIKISWNDEVGALSCSGKLDLKEDLDEVFNVLRKAAPIEITRNEENINIIVKH